MACLQEEEPGAHLALLVVLPSPCLVSLSAKAPLSQVARSLASLLRPRVALGTSPEDVVPACLCA